MERVAGSPVSRYGVLLLLSHSVVLPRSFYYFLSLLGEKESSGAPTDMVSRTSQANSKGKYIDWLVG